MEAFTPNKAITRKLGDKAGLNEQWRGGHEQSSCSVFPETRETFNQAENQANKLKTGLSDISLSSKEWWWIANTLSGRSNRHTCHGTLGRSPHYSRWKGQYLLPGLEDQNLSTHSSSNEIHLRPEDVRDIKPSSKLSYHTMILFKMHSTWKHCYLEVTTTPCRAHTKCPEGSFLHSTVKHGTAVPLLSPLRHHSRECSGLQEETEHTAHHETATPKLKDTHQLGVYSWVPAEQWWALWKMFMELF